MTQTRTTPGTPVLPALAVAVALLVAVLAVAGSPWTSLLLVAAGLTTWLGAVSTRGL